MQMEAFSSVLRARQSRKPKWLKSKDYDRFGTVFFWPKSRHQSEIGRFQKAAITIKEWAPKRKRSGGFGVPFFYLLAVRSFKEPEMYL